MLIRLRLNFLLMLALVLICVQFGSAIGNRHSLPEFSRNNQPHEINSGDDNVIKTRHVGEPGSVIAPKLSKSRAKHLRNSFHNLEPSGIHAKDLQQQSVHEPVHPLLMRSTTASVCLLFGLLIWRSLSSYEMADQFVSKSARLLASIPIITILFANVVGLAVNLIKPLNFKNHLKAILAANIVREWVEFVYNLFMVLFASARATTPRTEYLGRIFMNIWWNLICFSFIKSRWVLSESSSTNK